MTYSSCDFEICFSDCGEDSVTCVPDIRPVRLFQEGETSSAAAMPARRQSAAAVRNDTGITTRKRPAPEPEPERTAPGGSSKAAIRQRTGNNTRSGAPAAAIAAPAKPVKLGCSKCRFKVSGCGKCRALADAAAGAKGGQAMQAEQAPAVAHPALEVQPANAAGADGAAAGEEEEQGEGVQAINRQEEHQEEEEAVAELPAPRRRRSAAAEAAPTQPPPPAHPRPGCPRCLTTRRKCADCRAEAARARALAAASIAAAEAAQAAADAAIAARSAAKQAARAARAAAQPHARAGRRGTPSKATPSSPPALELGCTKCRFSPNGCITCRTQGEAGQQSNPQLASSSSPSSTAAVSKAPATHPPASPASVGYAYGTGHGPAAAAATMALSIPAIPKDDAWWDPSDASKVRQVKAALHVSTVPVGDLPLCRELQADAIDNWLRCHVGEAKGGSIYLSGQPGTGKTLTALELMRRCGRHAAAPRSRCSLPPALLAVNCMRLTEPRQVAERIVAGYKAACRRAVAAGADPLFLARGDNGSDEFGGARRGGDCGRSGGSGGSWGSATGALEELQRLALAPLPAAAQAAPAPRRASSGGRSSQERGMIVVVLDELDSLLGGRHGDALVGDLFGLAHAERSRLVIVGVANSVDLVQRLLRPGGAFQRRNLRPAHEIFPAYLRHQVSRLIIQRLDRLPCHLIDPVAVELCARKVSNGNGDMRRALEACSQAVDILAEEHKDHHRLQQQQQKQQNQSQQGQASQQGSPGGAGVLPGSSKGAVTALSAPPPHTVGLRQMAKALARVTGGIGVTNDNVAAIRALPVPQQLLMCVVGKLLGDTMRSKGTLVRLPSAAKGPGTAAARFMGHAAGGPVMVSDLLPVSNSRRRLSSAGGGADPQPRREVTLAELEEVHASLCRTVGVTAYTTGEFATAADVLCTLGLVALQGNGERKRRRVLLRVPEDDVVMALAEVPVLKHVVGA